jgi:hypothetical protein
VQPLIFVCCSTGARTGALVIGALRCHTRCYAHLDAVPQSEVMTMSDSRAIAFVAMLVVLGAMVVVALVLQR